ncbi:MAG: hypothetical protein Q9217_004617 [Psora testacea]
MQMLINIPERNMKRYNGIFTLSLSRLLFVLASIAALLIWYNIFSNILGPTKPKLYLNSDDTFHIAIFSDLHYGEDEHSFGIEQDTKSTALMRRGLTVEQPDFVILNGDLITGENTFTFNATRYVDKIVEPLVEHGYRWASTYGNHDSKYNLSREALFNQETKYRNSYTQHGPSDTDGVTNYVLPIYAPELTSKIPTRPKSLRGTNYLRPAALLWFFDSRGGSQFQHHPANVDNIENHVSNRTVSWFRSKSTELKRQYGTLPSLAFVHIPMKAFLDLQTQTSPAVHGPHYPGLNDDVPLAQQGYSDTGTESVPFMQALLDTPGLHSIYSAHDHGDSWCGRWPNTTLQGYGGTGRPFLCFCKHSGFGGYGKWNRGVRQVKLSFEEGDRVVVDTWVRMVTGKMITAVRLNDTYGEDVYPVNDGGYYEQES